MRKQSVLTLVSVLLLAGLFGFFLWKSGSLSGQERDRSSRKGIEKDKRAKALKKNREKLLPLHQKMGKPRPGDWLLSHPEPGQTFEEYLKSDPVMSTAARNVLYVQPLGEFTPSERKIVNLTADFMGRYFNCKTKILKDLSLDVIPKHARRVHPTWGVKQILSTYVLDKVLRPRLPKDAVCLIAFTASDLWPGKNWNFVFGQASLRARVGVWSINRNGNPDIDKAGFRLCLLRTLKTATHETGHMFSIPHCIAYECNMCGSNSRSESDRRPVTACPECVSKICWATKADPVERYKKLAKFCKEQELKIQAKFYEKSFKTLTADKKRPAQKK